MATSHNSDSEELRMFVQRVMHFMNLWTVYKDLLTGSYVPSLDLPLSEEVNETPNVQITIMLILYSYFYSLIEDGKDSQNGFRIWRKRFPEEEEAISAVEAQVLPFAERLRVFRNRIGFHGSRSEKHQSPGYELFAKHSGDEIFNAMKDFKALNAALLSKDLARQYLDAELAKSARTRIDAVAARAAARGEA